VRAEQIGSLALASYVQSKVSESTPHADSSREHLFGNQEFVMRIANLWVRHILQDDAACVRLPATEAVRDIMTSLGTPERQQIVLENALNTLCGKNKQSSTYSLRQTAIRLIYQLSLSDDMIVSHSLWKRYPAFLFSTNVQQVSSATHSFSDCASLASTHCWRTTSIPSNVWHFVFSAASSLKRTGICSLRSNQVCLARLPRFLMTSFRDR
jgi:hypothetical protein